MASNGLRNWVKNCLAIDVPVVVCVSLLLLSTFCFSCPIISIVLFTSIRVIILLYISFVDVAFRSDRTINLPIKSECEREVVWNLFFVTNCYYFPSIFVCSFYFAYWHSHKTTSAHSSSHSEYHARNLCSYYLLIDHLFLSLVTATSLFLVDRFNQSIQNVIIQNWPHLFNNIFSALIPHNYSKFNWAPFHLALALITNMLDAFIASSMQLISN